MDPHERRRNPRIELVRNILKRNSFFIRTGDEHHHMYQYVYVYEGATAQQRAEIAQQMLEQGLCASMGPENKPAVFFYEYRESKDSE